MCLLHLLSMTEKRKEPKARICLGLSSGGEKGIRTLEALSTLTRFPVVRLRPAQPSLRAVFALTKTLYHLLFALSSKKCIFLIEKQNVKHEKSVRGVIILTIATVHGCVILSLLYIPYQQPNYLNMNATQKNKSVQF